MGKTFKASGGGNKAARMAQKEEAAASRERADRARDEEEEDNKWSRGSKRPNKKDEDAAKRADQLAEKAKRKALAAAEDAELPDSTVASRRARQSEKKSKAEPGPARRVPTGGLGSDDEEGGDDEESKKLATINASGIDNALDALELDNELAAGGNGGGGNKIDRHPERRYGPAFERFLERRLEEMKTDGSGKGLRGNQRRDQIRKEFERHEDNPFNQLAARYNSTKEEMRDIRQSAAAATEARLAERNEE